MTAAQVGTRTLSPTSDYNARFRESIDAEFPTLEGRQEPERLVCDRGGDRHHGEKAIKLAKSFGMKLMPWQEEQVFLALSVDADGHWLHPDVVLICPRQNGKSLILEVIVLYRLFKLNHQIVFSAQQWRTAKSIRNRIWKRVKSRPWAARRLVRNTASAGEAEMETVDGGKVQFSTRSNDMGRGFDEIDLLIIDEAYNLDSGEMDAVAPTQLAAEDPQTYYTSSAVNEFKHPKGEELSRVRDRALSGDAEGLLFSEFAAPEGMDPGDLVTWMMANPSYGVVANEKKIRSLRSKLTAVGFEVEMLGWGRWFSTLSDADEALTLIDIEQWSKLHEKEPRFYSDHALAFKSQALCALGADFTPDGTKVGLAAAITIGDKFYLSLSPITEFVRAEFVESVSRTMEISEKNRLFPTGVALDPTGPGSTVLAPLQAAGVYPDELNGGQVSKAWELFKRLWAEDRIIHDGAPRWTAAWLLAQERSSKGRYPSLDRYASDVSVLNAAVFAIWALQEFIGAEDVPVVAGKKFVGKARAVRAPNRAAALQF